MRKRVSIQPGTKQQVPRFLARHSQLVLAHGRLEQGLKLGLICRRDECQAYIWDFVRFRSRRTASRRRSRCARGSKRGRHLAETSRLRLHGSSRLLGHLLLRREGKSCGLRQLWLLLLLLLKLLLVLLRDRRHRRRASLERLLLRGRLAWEACKLRLQLRSLRLRLLKAWIPSVLLLKRCRSLTKACGLRSKRTRLLLSRLLLLSGLTKGAPILLSTRTQATAAS